MKIRIKRFDKTLPLPKRHTEHAAAFDLTVREATTIAPQQIGYVPVNAAIETPPGHFLLIAARSSLHKRGLFVANGIGIVDPDYSGDEDELKAALWNYTNAPVTLEKGDRIVQGIFIKAEAWEWEDVETMGKKSRGGYGTTGHR